MESFYEKGGRQKGLYTSKDVIEVPCPFCAFGGFKKIYQERAVLGVVRCLGCGLIYVSPRLKEPQKVYWGEEDKYIDEARLIFEGKAFHHRDPNYEEDISFIRRYKQNGNFLDIGTNMGFFLRKARGLGWNLYGVEPSASLSHIARKYFGLNIKTAYLEEARFTDAFFDVVTMTDVFEHITEPLNMLSEVRRILKPDGILFIKVPNGRFNLFKFYLAKFLNKLSAYDIFDSYEHVVHYSDKTIDRMLKKSGFKVKKFFIGKPIQLPVWHNYVGSYYQYPAPWRLDFKRQSARNLLYIFSLLEHKLRLNRIGFLAPNIICVAQKG